MRGSCASAALLAALLANGCTDGRVAIAPPLLHYEMAPGDHRIEFYAPNDWTVVNQGNEITIRKGSIEKGIRAIEIRDLGPAGRDGIEAEVRRSRDLWAAGKDADARWRLKQIYIARESFTTASQRNNFWLTLHELTGAPRNAESSDIDQMFTALLDSVRALEPPSFAESVDQALAPIEDLKLRREVTKRTKIAIDGHDALRFETRYRQTHADPRSYVVIRNGSRLLGVWTDHERPRGTLNPAWKTLVQSLKIRPAAS